jgi:hypothetical protein
MLKWNNDIWNIVLSYLGVDSIYNLRLVNTSISSYCYVFMETYHKIDPLYVSPAKIKQYIDKTPWLSYWSNYQALNKNGVNDHILKGLSKLIIEPCIQVEQLRLKLNYNDKNLYYTIQFLIDELYIESEKQRDSLVEYVNSKKYKRK